MALPILSHYDLHIKNFNSCELKFLIEYQYQIADIIAHPPHKCNPFPQKRAPTPEKVGEPFVGRDFGCFSRPRASSAAEPRRR